MRYSMPAAAASQPLAAMVRRVATSLCSESSVSASLAGRILVTQQYVSPPSRTTSTRGRDVGGKDTLWAHLCSSTEWFPMPAPNSMTVLPSSEDTSCLASASPAHGQPPSLECEQLAVRSSSTKPQHVFASRTCTTARVRQPGRGTINVAGRQMEVEQRQDGDRAEKGTGRQTLKA